MSTFATRGPWLRIAAAAAGMALLGGGGCVPPVPPHAPQEQARLAVATTQPAGTYRPGERTIATPSIDWRPAPRPRSTSPPA